MNEKVGQADRETINVVTFNIHKGWSPMGRRKTVSTVKHLLEKVSPDIVCLQEVAFRFWPGEEEERFESQLEFLASTHWPHKCYQKNATYPRGHHGNAILSRWPIEASELVDLSLNSLEHRGVVRATIRHSSQKKIHVMCTHLNLLGSDRRSQEEIIYHRFVEKMEPGVPTILCGDFNDWKKEIYFGGELEEAFQSTHGQFAKSFPSVLPLLPLDRIYFKNLDVLESEVLCHPKMRLSSDHLALRARFSF